MKVHEKSGHFRPHWPLKQWSTGGCPPFGAGFEGAQPLATFQHFQGRKDGLGRILSACGSPGYADKQFRTAPDASGEQAGQERVGRGRKTGSVSRSLVAAATVARPTLQHRRIALPVLPRMAQFGLTARHRP